MIMMKVISFLAGVLFGVFALSGAEAKDEIVQVRVRFQANRITGSADASASLPHPGPGVNTPLREGRSVYHVHNWRGRAQLRRPGYFGRSRHYYHYHRGFGAVRGGRYRRVAAAHAIREGGAPTGIHDMIARHAAENGVP